MRKAIRVRGECQKNIVKLMGSLSGRYSLWEIWQDFIVMTAISIANVMPGPHRESREKQYMDRANKYTPEELETFAEMLFEVTMELDRNPDQDFLGELFMSLGLGNEWKGQFFTPYNVCKMMAAMSYGKDLKAKIDRQGWVGVNDPACGAGALLIAFANECRKPEINVNYQTSVLFVAQDIDFLAGCMCYIQLSLLGCPGYVVIDNTLTHPAVSYDRHGLLPVDASNVWYTPMFCRDVWHYRRLWAQIDAMCRPLADEASEDADAAPAASVPAETAPALSPPVAGPQPLVEAAGGQLTLF